MRCEYVWIDPPDHQNRIGNISGTDATVTNSRMRTRRGFGPAIKDDERSTGILMFWTTTEMNVDV